MGSKGRGALGGWWCWQEGEDRVMEGSSQLVVSNCTVELFAEVSLPVQLSHASEFDTTVCKHQYDAQLVD